MKTTLARNTQKNLEKAIKQDTTTVKDKALTKLAAISIYLNLYDNYEIDILDFKDLVKEIISL